MLYSEITVKTNRESAELIAYFLEEVCMEGGVSIYDINDLLDNPSWDYKDDVAEKPYDKEVLVKGYCETEDTDGVLDFLRKKFAAKLMAYQKGIPCHLHRIPRMLWTLLVCSSPNQRLHPVCIRFNEYLE